MANNEGGEDKEAADKEKTPKEKRFTWAEVFCFWSKRHRHNSIIEDLKREFRITYVDFEGSKKNDQEDIL